MEQLHDVTDRAHDSSLLFYLAEVYLRTHFPVRGQERTEEIPRSGQDGRRWELKKIWQLFEWVNKFVPTIGVEGGRGEIFVNNSLSTKFLSIPCVQNGSSLGLLFLPKLI